MKIIAINKRTQERIPITDLYWFEEEMVHSFNDDYRYTFEFIPEPGDKILCEETKKV
jgi:hypothetical protein